MRRWLRIFKKLAEGQVGILLFYLVMGGAYIYRSLLVDTYICAFDVLVKSA